MQKIFVIIFSLSLLSCSTEKVLTSRGSSEEKQAITKPAASGTDTARSSQSAEIAQETQSQTITPSIDSLRIGISDTRNSPDSTSGEAAEILEKMEIARQHYLLAQNSTESGDTAKAEVEFEQAIQILNDLADETGAETGKDFQDLSKSLVEDYQKLLVAAGKIDESTSIFALREVLSQVVEQSDTTHVVVPKVEIKGTSVPLPDNDLVERNIAFFMGRFVERNKK